MRQSRRPVSQIPHPQAEGEAARGPGGAPVTGAARIYAELEEAFAAGARLLLLTDYDGTLVPIVPNPTEAWLAPEVRDDLRALARSPRVRVGVLSGRALHDVRTRVGIPELIYAGCHGLEVEGAGLAFRHPEAETQRPALRAIARALRLGTESIPGIRVELKGLSVAVHYRNVPLRFLARLEALVGRAVQERGGHLKSLRGTRVIEILPRVRWNKGECALRIREHVLARGGGAVTMLYMGDDRTDELAFEALAGKAITVKVGSARSLSAAIYGLPDVTDVQRLFSALAAEVQREM